jgi:hypothetical protein
MCTLKPSFGVLTPSDDMPWQCAALFVLALDALLAAMLISMPNMRSEGSIAAAGSSHTHERDREGFWATLILACMRVSSPLIHWRG